MALFLMVPKVMSNSSEVYAAQIFRTKNLRQRKSVRIFYLVVQRFVGVAILENQLRIP